MQRKADSTAGTNETEDRRKAPRSRRRSPRFAGGMSFGVAALLALLGACEQVETNRGTVIERTRVLGAHIAVEGAPLRSTPRPGETARVTWLVTAPDKTPPLGWVFVLCAPAAAGQGDDCDGAPLAVFQGQPEPGAELPAFNVTVPARDKLGATRALSIIGLVCAASQPQLTPGQPPSCTRGADGTSAFVSLPLEIDGDSNANPSLDSSPLWIDGQPWAGLAPGSEPACAELPQISAGSKDHVLRLATAPGDREPYMAMQGDPPRPVAMRESLQISQFSTAGKLERPFSTVEATVSDDNTAIEVKWEAPAKELVPSGGLVVRFTFVARDLRGGTAWTGRSLCVVP